MKQRMLVTTTKTEKIVLGPAMRALNDRQRQFVVNWNNGGGKNAAAAARAAGYSDEQGRAREHAHWLMHNPQVRAAMIEDLQTRFLGDAAEARATLAHMAFTPGKDQYKALMATLHHGGMIERTIQQVDHKMEITFSQKVDQVKQYAQAVVDDKFATQEARTAALAVLKKYETVVDAEYEEVAPADDIPDLEGLV